jgi:general secretion pathway protein K
MWMLVLIAFITIHVTAAGRTEVRIATNLAANARAQAAAEGAIYQAVFSLADPQLDQRWMPDGRVHELQIGDSRIAVQIENEAGRINPNLASAALLQGLLNAIGAEPETSFDLAVAITEWVGSAPGRRTPDELLADYRAAGFDYGPPTLPLESIDQLGSVRGMSAQLLDGLRPHLSLFSPASPDVASADPQVAAAVAFADRRKEASLGGLAQQTDTEGPVTVRILASAHSRGNAEVMQSAIMRIDSFNPIRYSLLAWVNGIE